MVKKCMTEVQLITVGSKSKHKDDAWWRLLKTNSICFLFLYAKIQSEIVIDSKKSNLKFRETEKKQERNLRSIFSNAVPHFSCI